jgi:hypothetical protein
MPLGEVMYESGGTLTHVYFPTTSDAFKQAPLAGSIPGAAAITTRIDIGQFVVVRRNPVCPAQTELLTNGELQALCSSTLNRSIATPNLDMRFCLDIRQQQLYRTLGDDPATPVSQTGLVSHLVPALRYLPQLRGVVLHILDLRHQTLVILKSQVRGARHNPHEIARIPGDDGLRVVLI